MRRLLLCMLFVVACFVLLIPSTLSFAAASEVVFTARYRQDTLVTLDLASPSEILSLDPAIASDGVSITALENLFLGLTDLDPITNQIRPEMATHWDISEDGTIWTFHLRDDVMWMRYDPATNSATAIRPVVAEDFVYGIKRSCDPRYDGYYGTVIANVIAGCDVINMIWPEEVTDDMVFGDTTQVRAIDEQTLEITLSKPAGYFLSMTSMWPLFAVPREAIEEYGEDWTVPGNVITNGPYFVHENWRGVGRVFVRNDALPTDLYDGGNIERVANTLIEDSATIFALYHHNRLDVTSVPAAELEQVLTSNSPELLQIYDLAVFYIGFAHNLPPFDNVHVRRAFSAIIDREAFVQQIRQRRGVPMIHFTPPGMLHAPPVDGVGVVYVPDYAREQMVLAGYPGCEGLPPNHHRTL